MSKYTYILCVDIYIGWAPEERPRVCVVCISPAQSFVSHQLQMAAAKEKRFGE